MALGFVVGLVLVPRFIGVLPLELTFVSSRSSFSLFSWLVLLRVLPLLLVGIEDLIIHFHVLWQSQTGHKVIFYSINYSLVLAVSVPQLDAVSVGPH